MRKKLKELEEENERLRRTASLRDQIREKRDLEMMESLIKQEKTLKEEIQALKREKSRLEDELIASNKTKELNGFLEKELRRMEEIKREDERRLEETYSVINSLREDFREFKIISDQENRSYSQKCDELERTVGCLEKALGSFNLSKKEKLNEGSLN